MARRATKGRPPGCRSPSRRWPAGCRARSRTAWACAPRAASSGSCITLFAFILICNWLAALPSEHYIPPPTADVNLVYPLVLLVIVWVNVAGIRANGAEGYFGHLTKPYVALAPIEFITQYLVAAGLAGPAAVRQHLRRRDHGLGHRADPAYILWLPNAGWKLFDMFIGVIQALIFTLLTLIYFSEAVAARTSAAH